MAFLWSQNSISLKPILLSQWMADSIFTRSTAMEPSSMTLSRLRHGSSQVQRVRPDDAPSSANGHLSSLAFTTVSLVITCMAVAPVGKKWFQLPRFR